MPDEIKGNDQPSPAGGNADSAKPTAPASTEKPATPPEAKTPEPAAAEAKPAPPSTAKPVETAVAAKPAAPPAAAAAPKPAPPAKAPVPTPQPWESELVSGLKSRYGTGIREASTYLGQKYLVVDSSILTDILQIMRDDENFDYCVDITAAHYPKREEQFDVIWILYSFANNTRVRVKTLIKEDQEIPSSVGLWATANWLEREVFDMFGIRFTGHPDLRRILLPEGWKGYPLRKDYDILLQDKEWVQINLGIESGQ